MREVAIIGIGQTTVDEHWDKSLRELAGEAVFAAFNDAQRSTTEGLFVGNMLSGMLSKQENLGALIADWIGLPGIEAMKVEAACASGAAALRAGLMAVSSGEMDSALVLGIEKMTEGLPVETTEALATAADADYEAAQGLSFVAINALVMQRYLYVYGWKHTDFAQFSSTLMPMQCTTPTRLHERITEKEYNRSRMVAAPINLMDASPTGDGAAAVLLVPVDMLKRGSKPMVKLSVPLPRPIRLPFTAAKIPCGCLPPKNLSKKAYALPRWGRKTLTYLNCTMPFNYVGPVSRGLWICRAAKARAWPKKATSYQTDVSPLQHLAD
jgi:acetyl-CoA C-acetyltransferase